MTHRGVEIVLGRLATDEALRRRFRQAPAAVLKELIALGIELSPVELGTLESLDPAAVHRFAQTLDPRLQKAVLVAEGASSPRDEEDGAA